MDPYQQQPNVPPGDVPRIITPTQTHQEQGEHSPSPQDSSSKEVSEASWEITSNGSQGSTAPQEVPREAPWRSALLTPGRKNDGNGKDRVRFGDQTPEGSEMSFEEIPPDVARHLQPYPSGSFQKVSSRIPLEEAATVISHEMLAGYEDPSESLDDLDLFARGLNAKERKEYRALRPTVSTRVQYKKLNHYDCLQKLVDELLDRCCISDADHNTAVNVAAIPGSFLKVLYRNVTLGSAIETTLKMPIAIVEPLTRAVGLGGGEGAGVSATMPLEFSHFAGSGRKIDDLKAATLDEARGKTTTKQGLKNAFALLKTIMKDHDESGYASLDTEQKATVDSFYRAISTAVNSVPETLAQDSAEFLAIRNMMKYSQLCYATIVYPQELFPNLLKEPEAPQTVPPSPKPAANEDVYVELDRDENGGVLYYLTTLHESLLLDNPVRYDEASGQVQTKNGDYVGSARFGDANVAQVYHNNAWLSSKDLAYLQEKEDFLQEKEDFLQDFEPHRSTLSTICDNIEKNIRGDANHRRIQLLLEGPPACGKTTLAKRLERLYSRWVPTQNIPISQNTTPESFQTARWTNPNFETDVIIPEKLFNPYFAAHLENPRGFIDLQETARYFNPAIEPDPTIRDAGLREAGVNTKRKQHTEQLKTLHEPTLVTYSANIYTPSPFPIQGCIKANASYATTIATMNEPIKLDHLPPEERPAIWDRFDQIHFGPLTRHQKAREINKNFTQYLHKERSSPTEKEVARNNLGMDQEEKIQGRRRRNKPVPVDISNSPVIQYFLDRCEQSGIHDGRRTLAIYSDLLQSAKKTSTQADLKNAIDASFQARYGWSSPQPQQEVIIIPTESDTAHRPVAHSPASGSFDAPSEAGKTPLPPKTPTGPPSTSRLLAEQNAPPAEQDPPRDAPETPVELPSGAETATENPPMLEPATPINRWTYLRRMAQEAADTAKASVVRAVAATTEAVTTCFNDCYPSSHAMTADAPADAPAASPATSVPRTPNVR